MNSYFFRTAHFALLIALVLLFGCSAYQAQNSTPTANKGLMDLRKWDFQSQGPVKLKGEWEFFWKQLLLPLHFNAPANSQNDYFSVPGTWNGLLIENKELSNEGFATFRLKVHVDETYGFMALKVPEMSTSYKLWVNGKALLQNGLVGKTKDTAKPQYLPKTVVFPSGDGEIDLILQISNFVHRSGGIRKHIEIGTVEQILKIREETLTIEFLLFGSIFIMGFYHLGIYYLRPKDRSPLYFGIFCFLVALRVVLTGERILYDYLSWLDWGILIRLEYYTSYLATPMFLVFLGEVFKNLNRFVIKIAVVISLALIILTTLTGPEVFTHTTAFFQIFLVSICLAMLISFIPIIMESAEGATIILGGCLILMASVIFDVLAAKGFIVGFRIESFPFGLFIFILAQSFYLSIRFSRAFSVAEYLSAKLELKVEERTQGLKKANEEIGKSNKLLKETQNQLIQSQKMEAMGTLAGGIAHEFNNILSTMMGYTELMRTELKNDPTYSEYLNAVFQSGERAAELVNQILTFSRNDNQEFGPLNVQDALNEILSMIRTTLPESITIEETIDNDCRPINGNQTQISQIILNLCANAVQSMDKKNGVIKVNLQEATVRKNQYLESPESKGPFACLSIIDSGSGISANIKNRIFDPFFTTKDVNEGSGLGLSIVHGIVTNHKGFITVDSTLGQGSCFRVFIPITDEKPGDIAKSHSLIRKGKGHIMVVEDDPELSKFYSKMLLKLGFQATVLHDGQQALDEFKQDPKKYDLVFSDQMMPRLTGLELSKQIRKEDPGFPIILASGYSAAEIKKEIDNLPNVYFLNKPVRISVLMEVIQRISDTGSDE